jgi:hypothetical protein
MQHAYLIDSTARTISAVTFKDLAALKALVGGFIEVACQWPNGDTLYVDEEGLLKEGQRFFAMVNVRPDQAFAGNGVLVGREEEGEQFPAGYINHPPMMTIDELRACVQFPGPLTTDWINQVRKEGQNGS